MTTQPNTSQNESTYPIDAESAAEMARLMHQSKLMLESMGGFLPEQNNELSNVHDALDIGCGPGVWVLDIARAYADSDIQVTGIDISEKMINYAQAHAQAQQLSNAHFRVMNALQPLDFPDNSFDLVSATVIVGFMLPGRWPDFLQECKRILRPGGTIRLTEPEWGFTNKAAIEKLCALCSRAMHLAGQGFSPNGYHLGILPVLHHLLRDAGFSSIEQKAYILDSSAGTKAHESTNQNLLMTFKLLQPFFLHLKVTTPEEFDTLYQQATAEMLMDDYCFSSFVVTAWGKKEY